MTEHDTFDVVRNDEEQYSIWSAHREPPAGWHPVGFTGAKDACLAHIDEVWTDMRPLSLREALAAAEGRPTVDIAEEPLPVPDLVTRLCEGSHVVELVLRPEPSLDRLRTALGSRYVHLLFPDTNGGTELGVTLRPDDTDVSEVDWEGGTGSLRLVGDLTVDFEELRCTAVVNMADLTGHGSLARLARAGCEPSQRA